VDNAVEVRVQGCQGLGSDDRGESHLEQSLQSSFLAIQGSPSAFPESLSDYLGHSIISGLPQNTHKVGSDNSMDQKYS
jgi:hypothetical protein